MINEKNLTIQLPGTDREALVILKRDGQQPPYEGDKVVVRATVKLPAKVDNFNRAYLIPEITFGERVFLCGEYLHHDWGYYSGKGEPFRYRGDAFASEKWSSAFEKAEEWACREVKKLVDALTKRLEALKEAED